MQKIATSMGLSLKINHARAFKTGYAMRKRFWKGLKPIEFAIILVVVGITLGVFIWRYDHFKARAIESEARFYLKEIYAAQMLFKPQHNRFALLDELISLGLVVVEQKYYYFTDIEEPTDKKFLIEALGKKNTLVEGERWSIDQTSELKRLSKE